MTICDEFHFISPVSTMYTQHLSPNLLKRMGLNLMRLFKSIIRSPCPRPITLTLILTELWHFLNLHSLIGLNSTSSRLLFYFQALRIVATDTALFIFQLIWLLRWQLTNQ
jgi:hypothetical protein